MTYATLIARLRDLIADNNWTGTHIAAPSLDAIETLERQRDELLAALKMVEWVTYDDPDWGTQEFCPNCRMEKKHGHYECRLEAAIASIKGENK